MPRPKAPSAEETRAQMEADATYVSPLREPPIIEDDELLEAMANGRPTDADIDDRIWTEAETLVRAHANRGLHAKLAEVMLEVGRIPKNGTAPAAMGGYKFVQVGDAAEPIRKALAERGVTCMPYRVTETGLTTGGGSRGNMTTQTLEVIWRFTDAETGQTYDLPALGTGADSGDKFSPKAQTNAMKYMMLMGFLLPTGDDPEAADLSEPAQGGPINITGSNIEGVRVGGRQTKVTQAQLDEIRRGARTHNLSPEALVALIGSALAGNAPDLGETETLDDQQRHVLDWLGELSFDDAGTIVRTLNAIPPADDQDPA